MRILVVEDEVSLAAALSRGLKAEGFAVDTAHTGPIGLWMAKENAYDAIVLDILLPGFSGYKVCSGLREAGIWTPVLMLTAKDGDLDEAEALDGGADDYLTKPFSFVVLLARIRALMRRGAMERPAVLSSGSLSLDPASHRVERLGVEITLTAREFSLLELLMRRPGQVLGKREILSAVWGDDFEGDPNIVEVYIGYLRRKVDAPFGCQSIRTRRGAGYLLEPDQA
ncbi:MAG: response regulator transcription factor [Actinomycetota bacterium]|nr:response regulator transcription factor [Actinomycetota bacterium]